MKILIFDCFILLALSLCVFNSLTIASFFKCSDAKVFTADQKYLDEAKLLIAFIFFFTEILCTLSLMLFILVLLAEKLDKNAFISLIIFLVLSTITGLALESKISILAIYEIKLAEYTLMLIAFIYMTKVNLIQGKYIL